MKSSNNFCMHGKRKDRCRLCGGSGFCAHDKRKDHCNLCDCYHGISRSECALCLKHKKQKKYYKLTQAKLTPVKNSSRASRLKTNQEKQENDVIQNPNQTSIITKLPVKNSPRILQLKAQTTNKIDVIHNNNPTSIIIKLHSWLFENIPFTFSGELPKISLNDLEDFTNDYDIIPA